MEEVEEYLPFQRLEIKVLDGLEYEEVVDYDACTIAKDNWRNDLEELIEIG